MRRDIIEQVVRESGLWNGDRFYTHRFVLSPSVFRITEDQRQTLTRLGEALQECLAGFGRIAAIACDGQLAHNKAWGMISRIVHTGVPKHYHEVQIFKPGRVPVICKVDYMLATDGRFYIAEIDGHNKHGLGYATLAARIRKAIAPDATVFPGTAAMVAEAMAKQSSSSLTLLYADQEVFYDPEFQILRNELKQRDINLAVVAESSWHPTGADLEGTTLVDLPFLYHNLPLNERLIQMYREGRLSFLIPPKPFLGSKALLALLRNDEQNADLEAILRAHIPYRSLELLRGHIPETYVVNKQRPLSYWESVCQRGTFVLKESISSGMKGTAFTEDGDFAAMLRDAGGSFYRFILQREVVNAPQRFHYFGEQSGDVFEDNWYMRVTVHYSVRRIADITVTARRDKKAHGAKDCLQLGTVIT